MANNVVAFVGLGAIGLPMAQQVRTGGFDVIGVEQSADRRELAASIGLRSEPGIAGAAGADFVVVMVATPEQLGSLVDEALGAIDVRDQCWIVMSTVGPSSVRAAAARLQDAGARVVDSPVTGGVVGAEKASLLIFASGAAAAVQSCEALLATMGKPTTVGEDVGTGQSYKLVNQHLCVVHLAAAAEALAFAGRLGLNQRDVLQLVEQGAASSWLLRDRGPRMVADGDIQVTSAVAIMQKDCALARRSSQEVGAATPILDAVAERFNVAESMGLTTSDDSQLIRTYD